MPGFPGHLGRVITLIRVIERPSLWFGALSRAIWFNRESPWPDLNVAKLLARGARPSDGNLAFLDMLFCRAALIVEGIHRLRRAAQVGHDKTEPKDPTKTVPACAMRVHRFSPSAPAPISRGIILICPLGSLLKRPSLHNGTFGVA